MVQRERLAVMKDVQIRYTMEECVKGTERRGRLAVTRDVPTKLRKEEYALVMVPRSPKLAVTGDVPTKPDKAEYWGQGQAVKSWYRILCIPIMHRKEEFVRDMAFALKDLQC